MLIKDLAAKVGLAPSAIRYYEEAGLLPRVRRSANGYRAYGSDHLERLRFIGRCRSLDMSLEDIRAMTKLLFEDDGADPDKVHAIVEEQLAEVDRRLAELREMREQLLDLTTRCRHHHHHAEGEVCEMVSALRCECSPAFHTSSR